MSLRHVASPRPLLVRVLLVLAIIVGTLSTTALRVEAVTRPETLYREHPVGVGVVETDFPIEHLGVVFDLPPGEDAAHDHAGDEAHGGVEGVAVRFRTDGRWGRWQPVVEDGAQAVGSWTGALVAAGDADGYQVRGIPSFARNARAAALNTTDGPRVVVGHRPAGAAEAVTACKSRADWGADESIRTSTRSYAAVQVLSVHHTATTNDDPDPDARVRAIYEYHVRTNGWDDIGYQALIGEDGTVYEGRWSGSDSPSCASGAGTGWEFGHDGTTADASMVTGAHIGGYNTGNFGVALLGTLNDVAPKPAARDALVEYLGELADRHGLDPEGTVAYDNGTNAKTVDTISGHRDFVATECPGGTLYADLPAIRRDVAAALATNSAPLVSVTSPTTNDTFTVEEPSAGSGVDLSFAATATDESTTLSWSWTDAAGATVASTASFDTTLAVGQHRFTATAADPEGLSGSDTITVEVLAHGTSPAGVDALASGEQTISGTVTGSYVDTRADDDVAETITEVEHEKGPPSNRYSHLEHIWSVPVPSGGSTVTLFVDATATSSGEGDDFRFDYSLDGGQTWASALTFVAGSAGTLSAPLPSGAAGDVRIRVRDTDRSKGARALDRISVDHLFIRSETTATTTAPNPPATVSPVATSATTMDVTWSDVADEDGYEVERGADSDGDGVLEWVWVATVGPDVTSHGDTRLVASTAYAYRVRAYNGAGSSAWAVSDVETTPAATGISLSAEGYKVKGQHHVKLTWSGATHVRIYRDGVVLVSSFSGSEYVDATGGTGKATYTHQVCALDGSNDLTGTCSNQATTPFS